MNFKVQKIKNFKFHIDIKLILSEKINKNPTKKRNNPFNAVLNNYI